MTKSDFSFICEEIYEELGKGDAKYGPFDGPQDALGTIRCEVEELAREINRENPQPGDARLEALQGAAMHIKAIRDCFDKMEEVERIPELLPCPYCGKVKSLIINKECDDGMTHFNIYCDASTGANLSGCGGASGYEDTKMKAIALWNTRKHGQD